MNNLCINFCNIYLLNFIKHFISIDFSITKHIILQKKYFVNYYFFEANKSWKSPGKFSLRDYPKWKWGFYSFTVKFFHFTASTCYDFITVIPLILYFAKVFLDFLNCLHKSYTLSLYHTKTMSYNHLHPIFYLYQQLQCICDLAFWLYSHFAAVNIQLCHNDNRCLK